MGMKVVYTGGMRFDVKVRGHNIIVDKTAEHGGKDEGPMPPEFFMASIGTCIGSYAIWYCREHKISHEGMTINLSWSEAKTPPERIGYIEARITLPKGCPEEHKSGLLSQAEKCMLTNTITQSPEIKVVL